MKPLLLAQFCAISTHVMRACVCVSLASQGDLKPEDAASMLTIYEGKFTRLKDDRDNLIKAKEALELADPGKSG